MSDRTSALPKARFDGQVSIRDAGLTGMITLRGDLGSARLQEAATQVAGVQFPAPLQVQTEGDTGLGWMSPDELLVLMPHDQTATGLAALQKSLAGEHHLAVDVSDARAVFVLEGEGARLRDVLAKLTPANLSPAALPQGELRRTRLAQVAAAFWFQSDTELRLICFRSVAEYVFGLLKGAAEPGSEVGYF